MKRIHPSLFLLLMAFSLLQCRKEPGYIGTPDQVLPVVIPPDPITANLQGNIVDERNAPAAGVSVTAGAQTTITDAKGYFRINNATLDKQHTLVLAQKAGYFKGIRLFAATSGTNRVAIKLIKKILAGTIEANAGGTVALTNGSKIALQPNGVVLAASNNNYSGTVNVYAQYIDPAAADIATTVPGSFAAVDKAGKSVVLTSNGMLAVELESAAGEKLQIKDGNTATLTSPIPTAAQSTAPATIALWYMEETTGLWREEGTATKQGNEYVGNVKHFSFWNCDFGDAAIQLSMKIVNAANLPLANTAVRITRPGTSWLTTAIGYTDSLGQVSGIVPSGQNLLLEVLDPCGNPAYTQNIAALSQSTDLGTITASASSAGIVTVRGKLVTCDNLPVSNGYAIINFDNSVRLASTNANGEYEASFVTCPGTLSTATILAVDNSSGGAAQQSTTVVVNLTSPVSNLSDIVTCGATPFAYINYNIDGVDYYWTEANSFQMFGRYLPAIFGPGTDEVRFQADNQPGNRVFVLSIQTATTTGTYPATVSCSDLNPGGQTTSLTYLPGFSATITNYANGWPEFFEGSFTGQYTLTITGDTPHTINGTFRIRHQF